jgi:hypothetical protein
MHTFEKRQCDRCRHRSVVKNMPTPLPFIPCPHPSPHPTRDFLPTIPAPTVQCPGPMVSGLLDHVTSSANGSGAPGAQHKFRTPLSPPSAGKTGSADYLPVEKKVSLLEGLGKEYKKWCETTVGKTGTQAGGRHVVIRAIQD